MKYLLDTNVCIRYLNGRSENIRKNIATKRPQDIFLCSIVKAELFYGSMKSDFPDKNLTRQKSFVDHFISLSFDDKAAEIYGQVRSQLEKAGTPIGPNDLLIAAIALSNDLTLATANIREFTRVENLVCEDWEAVIPSAG
ncbi:MAG: type II toxin-antitoxin system VapC family toxin [Candidatus Electrothrix sp. GW3-4]|uniref:type II toxin-antitoxin system tRNA(fMet)-specific endonuclease VapC n=1 Tax=Candidatus Electrothrix sp. GW3-4 TaxID=3126740 RepID=UPI0030CD1CEC